MKKVSTLYGIIILIVAIVIMFGGVMVFQNLALQGLKKLQMNSVQLVDATGIYKNNEYGFQMKFPDSWKGYTIEKSLWSGYGVVEPLLDQQYTGTLFIFKNPKTTPQQPWQDIPIMVFAPDIWKLVGEEKIAVSAAPIGPAKIGENSKYIFATPPRWYGFTDAVGFQEAVEIVKTFKAF